MGGYSDSEIIQIIEHEKHKDLKFDINLGDHDNWSLLIKAVLHGRKKLIRYLLLDPNINVNHRDYDGDTALHFCDQVSVLKLLLGRRDIDVNVQNCFGETVLYYFYKFGFKACVIEYLLDARVNTSIYEMTAWDIALRNRHPGIVKIVGNSGYTTLLRISNRALFHDIVRMIIEEYV